MSLLDNNTSASNSFPGWPNGVAKASAIGIAPFGVPQEVFAHRCDWFGGTNHPNIGVNCADPVYCAKTAADMKQRGFAGAFLDWYGFGHNTDKSLLVLRPELEKQGLKFALCVDGGTPAIKAATTVATRTQALIDTIAYARKTYFVSPAYLKVNGKNVLLFFGFSTGDYDWTKVRAALADCVLIFRWEFRPTQYSNRPYADGYFGWTDNTEEWIANVKQRAPGKLIVFGLNAYFNNTVAGDPVRCTWGVGQNKTILSASGQHLLDQLAVAKAHPEILFASFNTWNDYQEGSAIEPGLATGFQPVLTLSNNVLSWTQPGNAFASSTLLMSTANVQHTLAEGLTTNSYDLRQMLAAPMDATFQVLCVGKNSIQNVLSNTLTSTLSWR